MSGRVGNLLVVGVVAVATGLGLWWWLSRDSAASDVGVAELVARTDKIAGAGERDPEAIRALLQDIRKHPRNAEHPRLIRSGAKLLMLLGSLQKAWDRIADQALAEGADPADQLLAAHIQRSRHAASGNTDQGFQALSLARSEHDATNKPESLFLAWQMARRIGRMDLEKEFAERLQEQFKTSKEHRLVAVLRQFFKEAPDAYKTIPTVDKATAEALRKLEEELNEVPEELDIVLACAGIGVAEGRDEIVAGTTRLTRSVLGSYSSSIMARMLAGIGFGRLGQTKEALFHLDWLLQNHPDHPSADMWRGVAGRLREGGK